MKLIAFTGSLLIIVSSHSFLLRSYASFFSVNNYKKGADAILILGGSADTRAKKSIELLNYGYSTNILITQPAPPIKEYQKLWVSDFDNLKTILAFEKVKYKVVPSINGGAKSTFDEARDLLKYSEKYNLKRIIIVTDIFHTRRAKYAFDQVFKKSNCIIEIAGASNEIYDETNWWKTERGLNAYVSEIFKLTIYLISDNSLEGIKSE